MISIYRENVVKAEDRADKQVQGDNIVIKGKKANYEINSGQRATSMIAIKVQSSMDQIPTSKQQTIEFEPLYLVLQKYKPSSFFWPPI